MVIYINKVFFFCQKKNKTHDLRTNLSFFVMLIACRDSFKYGVNDTFFDFFTLLRSLQNN
jgi:hypothetical protein